MIIIWAIGGDIVIITYAQKKCKLNVGFYIKETVVPVIVIALAMYVIGIIPHIVMTESLYRLVICTFSTTISMFILIWIIALNNEEKLIIMRLIQGLLRKK